MTSDNMKMTMIYETFERTRPPIHFFRTFKKLSFDMTPEGDFLPAILLEKDLIEERDGSFV